MKKAIIDIVTFDVADIIQTSFNGGGSFGPESIPVLWFDKASIDEFNKFGKGQYILLDYKYSVFGNKYIGDNNYAAYSKNFDTENNIYVWQPSEIINISDQKASDVTLVDVNDVQIKFENILKWLQDVSVGG